MRSSHVQLLRRLACALAHQEPQASGQLGLGSARNATSTILGSLQAHHAGTAAQRYLWSRQGMPCTHMLSRPMLRPHLQGMPAGLFLRSFAQKSSGRFGDKPPVSMQGLIIAMILGAAGIAALKTYKDEKLQKVMVQSQEVVGKASVGGPFSLTDYDGKTFTDKDLRGEFALLYFGFTHCPDICPDELEKIAEALNMVEKQTGVQVVPVFISVDPERDTPARIKQYVKEFHPRMLGLTGDLEDVKAVSKSYRVYYSKTGAPGAKEYLVDHSIIHYLIDPAGDFVTFYGKNYTADQMAASIQEHLATWQAGHPDKYHPGRTISAPAPADNSPAAPAK